LNNPESQVARAKEIWELYKFPGCSSSWGERRQEQQELEEEKALGRRRRVL
jgi:hypothetical protein